MDFKFPDNIQKCIEFGFDDLFPIYRAVEIERINTILKYGIDVFPTDIGIFADFLDKSSEYGGDYKIIQILNPQKMRRSFRQVSIDQSNEETLSELRKEFRTELPSQDKKSIWFSQLDCNDNRLASSYEMAYGWYIPGDPFDVLLGLLIVGPDIKELKAFINGKDISSIRL